MSVFRVCSWWSVQCLDVDDSYSSENILVCKLGLHENEKDCIVVGSHNGILSIYYPGTGVMKNGTFSRALPDDLILEIKLNAPILGVVAGKFWSSSNNNENFAQLAILHPLSLSIYNVTRTPGITYNGPQSAIHLTVEHTLSKWCYSICKGYFGGTNRREFICILHIDNSLTLFEQDGIMYSRTLSGEASILSPIIYDQKSDAFIRVSSTWEVQSFSYQDVSECGPETVVSPTWSVPIGEASLQMIPVRITDSRTDILILGEHNLISISDAGHVNFVKKLDYTPVCFDAFVLGWYWEPNARLISAVVSDDSRLFIYDNSTLIWVAQLESTPKAILQSNIFNLPAALVMLYSKGLLDVVFLGSEPYEFKVPAVNCDTLSYENISKELFALEDQIKESIRSMDLKVIDSLAENYIDVSIETSNKSNIQDVSEDTQSLPIFSCIMLLKIKLNVDIDELQITFNSSEGIICSNKTIMYADLSVRTTYQTEVTFYIIEKVQVCSTKVEILISFMFRQSAPRTITKTCFLPQNLFYEAILQENDAANKMNVSLRFLRNIQLPEFVYIFDEQQPNFKSNLQDIVLRDIYKLKILSVLSTKGGLCSKIQSNCVEDLVPVLGRLVELGKSSSLKKTSSNKTSNRSDNVLLCSPDISMDDIISRILYHYEIQQEVKEKTAYMDVLWNQFKLFQRCLQTVQDVEAIDSINMLMAITYDDLIAEGDTLLQLQQDKYRAMNNLNCVVALLRLIIYHSNIDDAILNKVLPAINYPIEDWTKKSWEELSAPSFKRLASQRSVHRDTTNSFETEECISNSEFEFHIFAGHLFLVLHDLCQFPSSSKRQKCKQPNFELSNSVQHALSTYENVTCEITADTSEISAKSVS